ncbi:MAG: class I SAM-dependent methyltransferase [Burkholderiales bacterium]
MRRFLAQLFPDGPYFEGGTAGRQCTIARHAEIASLVSLVKRQRVDILEVGSWIGHSALTWSEAIAAFCPEKGTVVCIDPWAPYFEDSARNEAGPYLQMEGLASTGLAYDLFLHNVRFAASGVNIRHVRGSLPEFEQYLQAESFDIVYVDGSHYHDDVRTDLALAERLVRTGGILCGDDLELQLDECDADFARANPRSDFMADPRTGARFHPGVTTAVRDFFGGRVWSENGVWAMNKVAARTYAVPPVQRRRFIVPSQFPEAERAALAASLKRAQGS